MVKEGHLYRKAYNGNILKCVSKREADEILQEIHGGDCGKHQGGRRLYEEALRLGYFGLQWKRMRWIMHENAKAFNSLEIKFMHHL